jgi:hypothetical protein
VSAEQHTSEYPTYTVVEAGNAEDLAGLVNGLLQQDWMLVGGVSVAVSNTYGGTSSHWTYLQSMVKP